MLIYKKKGPKKKNNNKKIVASWFRTCETMLIALKLLKNSTYFVQPEFVFFQSLQRLQRHKYIYQSPF